MMQALLMPLLLTPVLASFNVPCVAQNEVRTVEQLRAALQNTWAEIYVYEVYCMVNGKDGPVGIGPLYQCSSSTRDGALGPSLTRSTSCIPQSIYTRPAKILLDDEIEIDRAVTIRGETYPGETSALIAKAGQRVLHVDPPASARVNLHTLAIRDGSSHSGGAGLLIESGHVMLQDCTIEGCHTEGTGGGAFVKGGAQVTFFRTSFRGNDALVGGGLFIALYAGAGGKVELTGNTEIVRNSAKWGGAGIYLGGGALEIGEYVNIADDKMADDCVAGAVEPCGSYSFLLVCASAAGSPASLPFAFS